MKKRKVTLVSLQPIASVEEKLFTKIPIKLMLKGSFVNIYNLLYDFETMNRMLVAENMTITRGHVPKCDASEGLPDIFNDAGSTDSSDDDEKQPESLF